MELRYILRKEEEGGADITYNGNPGGCGGGAAYGFGNTSSGGNDVSTNIVNTANGVISTGQTIPIQPTYAVFGNRGGDQLDNTYNKSAVTGAGGGGIGAAGGNHTNGNLAGGPGGAGLNQATINGITYNFKSYFANNNTFGDISGYIGGGGSGFAYYNLTQAQGGVGGGGNGAVNVNRITGISQTIATPGRANTGSGGGGGGSYIGYENSGGYENSSGGSGIVIIRYRS